MALLLIPAIFLGAIALGLFVLALAGMALMVVLGILTVILWVAVKIVERRSAAPKILIAIEGDECLMRDVTPRKSPRQLKVTAQR